MKNAHQPRQYMISPGLIFDALLLRLPQPHQRYSALHQSFLRDFRHLINLLHDTFHPQVDFCVKLKIFHDLTRWEYGGSQNRLPRCREEHVDEERKIKGVRSPYPHLDADASATKSTVTLFHSSLKDEPIPERLSLRAVNFLPVFHPSTPFLKLSL